MMKTVFLALMIAFAASVVAAGEPINPFTDKGLEIVKAEAVSNTCVRLQKEGSYAISYASYFSEEVQVSWRAGDGKGLIDVDSAGVTRRYAPDGRLLSIGNEWSEIYEEERKTIKERCLAGLGLSEEDARNTAQAIRSVGIFPRLGGGMRRSPFSTGEQEAMSKRGVQDADYRVAIAYITATQKLSSAESGYKRYELCKEDINKLSSDEKAYYEKELGYLKTAWEMQKAAVSALEAQMTENVKSVFPVLFAYREERSKNTKAEMDIRSKIENLQSERQSTHGARGGGLLGGSLRTRRLQRQQQAAEKETEEQARARREEVYGYIRRNKRGIEGANARVKDLLLPDDRVSKLSKSARKAYEQELNDARKELEDTKALLEKNKQRLSAEELAGYDAWEKERDEQARGRAELDQQRQQEREKQWRERSRREERKDPNFLNNAYWGLYCARREIVECEERLKRSSLSDEKYASLSDSAKKIYDERIKNMKEALYRAKKDLENRSANLTPEELSGYDSWKTDRDKKVADQKAGDKEIEKVRREK